MPHIPTVAIIGRPNTGKSTLFNRLVGASKAIVSDIPGTTRDHISGRVEGDRVDYLLVDTGGMGGGTEDSDFEDDVHAQSLIALGHADLILFVVNVREELTASDYHVVDLLRKQKRRHVPVLLAVAKCDNDALLENAVPAFSELGIAEQIIPVSAVHGFGIDELESAIEEGLTALHFGKSFAVGVKGEEREKGEEGEEVESAFAPDGASADKEGKKKSERMPRVALLGRPNVGKSSLINALMSDPQRKSSPLLVSDVPGTTRDSTDSVIKSGGKEFCFVDTAGLRKGYVSKFGSKRGEGDANELLEIESILRTIRSLEEADVAVLVLDASQPIAKQDKHIAGLVIDRGVGLIIVVNKADMMEEGDQQEKVTDIQRNMRFCPWAPVLFCSAQTRQKLPHLFTLINQVTQNRARRLQTSELNRWYRDILETHQGSLLKSPAIGGKYLTQVGVAPPTFAIFVKDPFKTNSSIIRFLENRMRDMFDFTGTPMLWYKKRK